jgi:hypothetical protein
MHMHRMLVAACALMLCACSLLLGDGLTGGDMPPSGSDGAIAPDSGDGGIVDDAHQDATADAAPRGLRFRASSKLVSTTRSNSFVLQQPAGTQPGDLLWVAVSALWDYAITPPSGFVQVTIDAYATCGGAGGGGGWALYVFSHVATANEPSSYTFTIGGLSEDLSAVMLALDGVAPDGALPLSDGLSRIAANPFAPPPVVAPPQETYALATFTERGGGTWPASPNMTRFTATTTISVFGRLAAASQSFDFGALTSTPDGCGQAHVALLRMK